MWGARDCARARKRQCDRRERHYTAADFGARRMPRRRRVIQRQRLINLRLVYRIIIKKGHRSRREIYRREINKLNESVFCRRAPDPVAGISRPFHVRDDLRPHSLPRRSRLPRSRPCLYRGDRVRRLRDRGHQPRAVLIPYNCRSRTRLKHKKHFI